MQHQPQDHFLQPYHTSQKQSYEGFAAIASPPTQCRKLTFDEHDRPTVTLPPPTTARGHQKARSTVDLPPLLTKLSFTSTSSTNTKKSGNPLTRNPSNPSPSLPPTSSSTFLPFLRTASSRSVSPERRSIITTRSTHSDLIDAGPNLSTTSVDTLASHKSKTSAAVDKLASWFEGTSESVHISILPAPKKERHEDEIGVTNPDFFIDDTDMDRLTRLPPKKQGLSSLSASIAPNLNFLRWNPPPQYKSDGESGDYLANVDIRDALFPSGQPEEINSAAFKNLQLNAEQLLRKFQTAYIEQTILSRTTTTRLRNQTDDLEAAQMKNEHLKLQLEEMAERAAEQERILHTLRAELAASNPIIDAPQQTIRKVSAESLLDRSGTVIHHDRFSRQKRTSLLSDADSEMSSAVSVFSQASSQGDSPGTSIAASPVMKHTRLQYPVEVGPRLDLDRGLPVVTVEECQKCHSLEGGEAWDIVGLLKVESGALKDRIKELERANDDALDFLRGLTF